MVEEIHYKGKKKGDILLYALSTCIWCKKTRRLLDELGVDYKVIEVDLIDNDADKETIRSQVKKWNKECTYPTLVIDDQDCIMGFDEDKIRERLKA